MVGSPQIVELSQGESKLWAVISRIYQGSVYHYSSLLDNSQDRPSTSRLLLLLIISSLKYIYNAKSRFNKKPHI